MWRYQLFCTSFEYFAIVVGVKCYTVIVQVICFVLFVFELLNSMVICVHRCLFASLLFLQRSRIELLRLYVFCDDNIGNLNFTSTQPGFNKSSRNILQNFREASHTEKPEIHSIHVCMYSCSFWNYWMTRELVYLYQTWTVVHTGTCMHMVWLSLQLVLEKKIKHSTPLHC